jgi:hypothetical protein
LITASDYYSTGHVLDYLRTPNHLTISGRTMEFDGQGKCVAGC